MSAELREAHRPLRTVRGRWLAAGLAAWLALAVPLEGQGRPLRAQAQQGLSFGQLLPGVPTTVPPSDGLNTAQIRIWGRRNREILISFLLPSGLAGPGGASIPLTFGPGSGGYSPSRSIGDQIPFDPTTSATVRLGRNGQGMIYLGGTAAPAGSTPPGSYASTVTLTLSYLGN